MLLLMQRNIVFFCFKLLSCLKKKSVRSATVAYYTKYTHTDINQHNIKGIQ